MQEQNVQRRPEYLAMLDIFKDKNYNDIITYKELDSYVVGGSVRDKKRYVFEKFRKEILSQFSKCLENIPNIGYRIVEPKEHTRLTSNKMKQAERRTRTAANIILHVDMEVLNEVERAKANLIASRVQNALVGLIGENKAIKHLTVHYKQPEIPRS